MCHQSRDLNEARLGFHPVWQFSDCDVGNPLWPRHHVAGGREPGWVGQQAAALRPPPRPSCWASILSGFGVTDKFGLRKIPWFKKKKKSCRKPVIMSHHFSSEKETEGEQEWLAKHSLWTHRTIRRNFRFLHFESGVLSRTLSHQPYLSSPAWMLSSERAPMEGCTQRTVRLCWETSKSNSRLSKTKYTDVLACLLCSITLLPPLPFILIFIFPYVNPSYMWLLYDCK